MPAETHIDRGPLDRQGVFELIRDQLADILEIDPSTITESSSFAEDLDADSLALIELVEALEEELGERTVGSASTTRTSRTCARSATPSTTSYAKLGGGLTRRLVDGRRTTTGRRRRWPTPGPRFADPSLLHQALSHRSWCGEQDGAPVQRAPRVPGRRRARAGGGRALLRALPRLPRGQAGQGRSAVVNARVLAEVAEELGVGDGAAARARARRPRAGGPRRRSWPTPSRR